MNLDEALKKFGVALGNLKRAYAEEYSKNPNYIEVHADDGDYVTMYSSNESGTFDAYREWVDTYDER